MFLIFGGYGWIGQQVCRYLESQFLDFQLAQSRADDKAAVEREILSCSPSHILCFIGRTHGNKANALGNANKNINTAVDTIDYLEGNVYENVRDNLFAPMALALLAIRYKIHLTYLGTGCIFQYDTAESGHPFGEEVNGFTEESRPNFFGSAYSTVKGFTDELMHLVEDNVLNVRIRMPITGDREAPRNFIYKITHYEKICSIPNSMTVLDDLIPVMIDLALRGKTGTYNMTNPGLISHDEILEMYRDIVDPKFEWKNFSLEEQAKVLKAGRSNNYLDTTKLQKEYPNIKNIRESVKDIMLKIKDKADREAFYF